MRKAITLATLTRTLAMSARKIDPVYPGTAVERLEAVHQRLAAIPQAEPRRPVARRAPRPAAGGRSARFAERAAGPRVHWPCIQRLQPLRPDDHAGRRAGRVERRRECSRDLAEQPARTRHPRGVAAGTGRRRVLVDLYEWLRVGPAKRRRTHTIPLAHCVQANLDTCRRLLLIRAGRRRRKAAPQRNAAAAPAGQVPAPDELPRGSGLEVRGRGGR